MLVAWIQARASSTGRRAVRAGLWKRRSRAPDHRGGRALVVEDEQDVAELLRYNLLKEGYGVIVARNGADALARARGAHPDLILLDVVIPPPDGWEVCRRLKREPETAGIPLIIVTGRAGDLEIDRERFEVTMRGQAVGLTPKEFELLAMLVGAPGRVFRREEILDQVWGREAFVEPRTVDVHLARVRRKFLAARVPEPGLEAVRGIGYRFRDGDQHASSHVCNSIVTGPKHRPGMIEPPERRPG